MSLVSQLRRHLPNDIVVGRRSKSKSSLFVCKETMFIYLCNETMLITLLLSSLQSVIAL